MANRTILAALFLMPGALLAQATLPASLSAASGLDLVLSCRPYLPSGVSAGYLVCNAKPRAAAPQPTRLGSLTGAGGMIWPSGSAGIPNYSGNSSWGPTFSASNPIPASFVPFAAPGNIGQTNPGAGQFIALSNHGAAGSIDSEFFGAGGVGGPSTATGVQNSAFGKLALANLTTGSENSIFGHVAGYSLTTGGQNVAVGESAMLFCTSCNDNTAVGWGAMGNGNMTGAYPVASENTAIGWESMFDLTLGAQNTALGENSLSHMTTGSYNTTTGADSQSENTTGSFNTSFGHDAMTGSTSYPAGAPTCDSGVFNGYSASYNTAVGEGAFCTVTTGQYNTVVGWQAGLGLSSGSGNTYLGTYAGVTPTIANANVSGSNNTFVGYFAGPASGSQFSNSTALGYNALVTASNQIVLGNSSVTQLVVPAGASIASQDSGAPAISFGPNSVSISMGEVTGAPSAVVATVPSNTFTAQISQPKTVFFTTTAAGQYQLCGLLSVKAAGAGTGTFSDVVWYQSDGLEIQTALGGAVPVATAGAANISISQKNVPNCFTAYLDNAAPIGWEILADGLINAAPTMRYGFTVTYLGP